MRMQNINPIFSKDGDIFKAECPLGLWSATSADKTELAKIAAYLLDSYAKKGAYDSQTLSTQ